MFNESQRLAGLSPELARNAMQIAQRIAERRIEDALRELIGALALAPNHPELLRLQGLIQFASGALEGVGTAVSAACSQIR